MPSSLGAGLVPLNSHAGGLPAAPDAGRITRGAGARTAEPGFVGCNLNPDPSVVMKPIEGDLFARFPSLRFGIPHGGGAVPYHWGRFEGPAARASGGRRCPTIG
jgi:hypothetical protein